MSGVKMSLHKIAVAKSILNEMHCFKKTKAATDAFILTLLSKSNKIKLLYKHISF